MPEHSLRGVVDRDSVCAGDDGASHEASFLTSPDASLVEFLQQAMRASPLARILGGRATWVIVARARIETRIGVIAQQWESPALLLPATTTVAALYGDSQPIVFFSYWNQWPPEWVLEGLRSGKLPQVPPLR